MCFLLVVASQILSTWVSLGRRRGVFDTLNLDLVSDGNNHGIYNWCVNAGVNHSAFVEHIVKAVALVRPFASTTEKSNFLHKLIVENRRADVKNARAF